MRHRNILVSMVTAVGIFVATQGCSLFDGNEATKEDRLCTPGAYVFCRCADRTPGTKLCKDDGKSFQACTTRASGECIGGEIEDPETNRPILPGEEPDASAEKPEPANAVDVCPGKSTGVQPGVDIKLEGDTKTATKDRKGRAGGACAAGVGANDHIYRLIPSGSGLLEVKVQGSEGLDPIAYLRTSCDDEGSQVSCGPQTASKLSQLKTHVVTGRDYFLLIDGASGSTGHYVATMKLTTGPFCGDGKVDDGEACDDGNKTEGDGCSNDCVHVDGNPVSGGNCPGHPLHLWPSATVTGTGSTASYGNAWNAPATSCEPSLSNEYEDHVYEITPHATGTLTVSVTPAVGQSRNFMLTARRTCADPATNAACTNDLGATDKAETMTVSVTNNQKVFIAVDGGGPIDRKGDYSISFKLQ